MKIAKKPWQSVVAVLVVLLVATAGIYLLSQSHANLAAGVNVSGTKFYKDGAVFVPRGFNMVGGLAPPGCSGAAAIAATHYGDAELTVAQTIWKSNAIRLQVSQNGMDPTSPVFTPAEHSQYMTDTLAKVTQARNKGLIVIVSMQDQSYGCGKATPIPGQATIRAWQNLAPKLASNQYVMLEAFNEPDNAATPVGWNNWQNGGVAMTPTATDKWASYTSVGHQAVINTIRATGATNVIIVDGAGKGESLNSVPILKDPLAAYNIAYAAHPYYYQTSTADWNARWGDLSASQAVIATEWNYQGPDCAGPKETMAPAILAYLKSKNIGVFGHALDVVSAGGGPQDLMADWSWTPTKCGTANGGGGQDFKNYLTGFTVIVPSCTVQPSAAANFKSGVTTASSVSLSWTAAVAGTNCTLGNYKLYRSIGTAAPATSGVALASPGSAATNYVDNTVSAGLTYSYAVVAYDTAVHSSAAVSVTAITPKLTNGTGDITGVSGAPDSRINALDYSVLISHDGTSYAPADLDHNGNVGASDSAILLHNWTW